MCLSVYLTLGLLMWMLTDMAAESAKRRERNRGFVQLLPLCVEKWHYWQPDAAFPQHVITTQLKLRKRKSRLSRLSRLPE